MFNAIASPHGSAVVNIGSVYFNSIAQPKAKVLLGEVHLPRIIHMPSECKDFMEVTSSSPRNSNATTENTKKENISVIEIIKSKLQEKNVLIISGIPGTGKTETAIYYANKCKTSYDIQWLISAKNLSELANIYKLFLCSLDYPAEKMDDNKIIDLVMNFFGLVEKKFLIIFDGVDDIELAKKIIDLLPHLEKHHIIITSQLNNWGVGNLIPLEPFTEDEATYYIVRELKKYRTEVKESDAKLLANTLNRLPITLSEAIHTIKNRFTVAEYLKAINKIKKRNLQLTNKKTTQEIFEISIKRLEEYDKKSAQMLFLLALTETNHVPKDLLKRLFPNDFENCLITLTDFSIIKVVNVLKEKDCIIIHQSWREALYHYLQEKLLLLDIFGKLLNLFNSIEYLPNSFYDANKWVDFWKEILLLLPHLLIFLEHANQLQKFNIDVARLLHKTAMIYMYVLGDLDAALKFLYAEKDIRMKIKTVNPQDQKTKISPGSPLLSHSLGNAYHRKGEFQTAEEHYLQAIAKEKSSDNFFHLSLTQHCLGHVYFIKNDFQNAKAFYEESIRMKMNINKQNGNNDLDPLLAASHHKLGDVYYAMDNKHEALKNYELAKKMAVDFFKKEENPEIADIYISLGAAYKALGDTEKADSAYEKALVIANQVYVNKEHPKYKFLLKQYQYYQENKGLKNFEYRPTCCVS